MMLLPTDQFPLWLNAALFLAASIIVWMGGTKLTNYVDRISELTGLGQAFAGMLLLGVITSLPEVANSISASSTGNPALAINNLLGSAAINIFMLAIGDAFVRRDALTSATASPATLMMSVLCILVLVIVAVAITVTDLAIIGVGIWSIAITGVSIFSFWLAAGYGARSDWAVPGESTDDRDDAGSDQEGSLVSMIVRTTIAGAVIFIAGYTLSETGDAIAEQTGMSSGLVGFALIGIATSTPELSTIIQAIRIKRYEMAFGQVLGTNFVNLSLILLADSVFGGGPVINELGRFETISALLGAAMIGVFLVGLLERRNKTIFRMGYDSLVVILLFGGGLVVLSGI